MSSMQFGSDDDPLIRMTEMADRAGVSLAAIKSARRGGYLPAPDDVSVSDRPRWRLSTFERWMTARPGSGRRVSDASDDPLLSITEMAALAGMHRQSIYRLRGEGKFPPPDDTAVRTRPRWLKSTFERWMADRLKPSARTTPHRKQALVRTGVDSQKDDQSGPGCRP